MTARQSIHNQNRLKDLKLASLKFKEAQLNLYIKKGYSDKMITQTMNEISQIKSEIRKLS